MVPFTEQARIFHKNHLEKHRLDKEMTRKIDRVMAVVGVMGPFATLFQVVHIFVVKTAAGISVYTWIGYMIVSLCWFIYGFFYKDKPLMIVNSLCFVIDAFLIVGFVLYH